MIDRLENRELITQTTLALHGMCIISFLEVCFSKRHFYFQSKDGILLQRETLRILLWPWNRMPRISRLQ